LVPPSSQSSVAIVGSAPTAATVNQAAGMVPSGRRRTACHSSRPRPNRNASSPSTPPRRSAPTAALSVLSLRRGPWGGSPSSRRVTTAREVRASPKSFSAQPACRQSVATCFQVATRPLVTSSPPNRFWKMNPRPPEITSTSASTTNGVRIASHGRRYSGRSAR